MVYSLAKSGWFNSNPEIIYQTPIDKVILAYQYEIMTRDYEATDIAINMEN